jgi:hypothetical protein
METNQVADPRFGATEVHRGSESHRPGGIRRRHRTGRSAGSR